MKINDALAILELTGHVDAAAVNKAWRAMAAKYHPDRNPAGENMMKLVNAARDALADYEGEAAAAPGGETQANYGEAINEALNAIFDLEGLEIEICGAWIWVGGDTRAHKDALKGAGFKWAPKKKKWNFRPAGWKSTSRGSWSMADIRAGHGTFKPRRPGNSDDPQPTKEITNNA